MTIEEAKAAIAKTKSPYLKRDLEKFIVRQEKRSKRRAQMLRRIAKALEICAKISLAR